LQHSTLGSEHLLLGLLREGESAAARVLALLGMTLEKMRKAVGEAKGRGDDVTQPEITLSADASMAIEMAMKEAERQFLPPDSTGELIGSTYMSESEAEKILQDGKLSQHLESLGVTLEDVRKALGEAEGRGVQVLFDQGSAANTPTEEAERRRHPFFRIDTRKLLVGVLRVPESNGVKILRDLGVPLKDVQMLVYLEEHGTLPISCREYAQRFTEPARKAWRLAHEEARRMQDSYVGEHHLLLGLVAEGSGVAATVLSEMGVGLEKLREQIEPGHEAGDWSMPGEIRLQPVLKNVIELASNEARRRYHPAIGTGHLLLVMVRGQDYAGMEAGWLRMQGVDLDKLRAELRNALKVGVAEEVADEIEEEGIYAGNASIASIERDLQSRELDKTILAVYPFALEVWEVLEDARTVARNLGQEVGPEHLLVGLAGLTFGQEGLVSKVFKELGIDYARVQTAVENRLGQGAKTGSVVLVQSALCEACMLLAVDEAEQRDGAGAQIKSEHLLLGLLREEKGIVADLLGDLGTSVEVVHTKVLSAL
jgi:ATP-dependent Clp protease ATP-binding subunit ClpA